MNINRIKVDNFWISFDVENVKAKETARLSKRCKP